MILFIPSPDSYLITQIKVQTVAGGEKIRHMQPAHITYISVKTAYFFNFCFCSAESLQRNL
jgi:hypothetical protein